jgi:hypothetical protein
MLCLNQGRRLNQVEGQGADRLAPTRVSPREPPMSALM